MDINVKDLEKIIYEYTEDLSDGSSVSGAMVCDYNTFKTIYQLNARAAARENKRVVIALVKVKGLLSSNIDSEERNTTYNKVGTVLASSLRRDDVVTGFDTSQYLIMLSNLSLEDGENVMLRLINAINKEIPKELEISTQLQAMESVKAMQP